MDFSRTVDRSNRRDSYYEPLSPTDRGSRSSSMSFPSPSDSELCPDIEKLPLEETISRRQTFGEILSTLSPSFTRRLSLTNNASTNKIRSTAYMDGLRGVASLFVFIHHYPLDYFHFLHSGWGAGPDDKNFLQLPFIRIIYSGRFMVAIFFLLSGYVLAHKPLQYIRCGNTAGLFDSLSSSVFRRGMRLFLPIIPSTFIVMLLTHFELYRSLDPIVPIDPPAPIITQTLQWLSSLVGMINPFTFKFYISHFSTQLWTLPVEFRGSMIVFISLLCFAKTRPAVRMSLLSITAYYCLQSGFSWDVFLFITGIILAEVKIIQKESTFEWDDIFEIPSRARMAETAVKGFWIFTFIISLFLASWPDEFARESTFTKHLFKLTPSVYFEEDAGGSDYGPTRFWECIAAVLMLVALENYTPLQRPFVTRLAKYLGDISFSLYIVHIPICYSIGRIVTVWIIDAVNSHVLGFIFAAGLVVPVTFWIADLWWRLIDMRSIQFAKWVWVWSSVPQK